MNIDRENTMETFLLSLLRMNQDGTTANPIAVKLAYWLWDQAPEETFDECAANRRDPEDVFAGVAWAMAHIMEHGLPTDLKEIIDGMELRK